MSKAETTGFACRSVANWGAESMRGSMDGSQSSMSSHIPSGMTGLPSVLQGTAACFALHASLTLSHETKLSVMVTPCLDLAGCSLHVPGLKCFNASRLYNKLDVVAGDGGMFSGSTRSTEYAVPVSSLMTQTTHLLADMPCCSRQHACSFG